MLLRTDEILDAARARAGNSKMLPALQRQALMVLLFKAQMVMTLGKTVFEISELTGMSLSHHFATLAVEAFPDLFLNHMVEFKTLEKAFLTDLADALTSDKNKNKNG